MFTTTVACELCNVGGYTMKNMELICSFAAVQVQFDPQNYTVTEGDVVSITLVTNTSDYMFNFTVTLQNMDGSATGESFKLEIHFTRTLKGILAQLVMKYVL